MIPRSTACQNFSAINRTLSAWPVSSVQRATRPASRFQRRRRSRLDTCANLGRPAGRLADPAGAADLLDRQNAKSGGFDHAAERLRSEMGEMSRESQSRPLSLELSKGPGGEIRHADSEEASRPQGVRRGSENLLRPGNVLQRVPHRNRIERGGRDIGMRQGSEVRMEFCLLPKRVDDPGAQVEPLDIPAVFAHLLHEFAGPAAEIEQPSGSSERDPALPSAGSSNDDASQHGCERSRRARRLGRITVAVSQQGDFKASPQPPADGRRVLAPNAARNPPDRTDRDCATWAADS